jgi:hypothetical protein
MSRTLKQFFAWMETEEGKNFGRTKCPVCHKFLDALDEQEPHTLMGKKCVPIAILASSEKWLKKLAALGASEDTARDAAAI